MQESAQAALSWVRSHTEELGVPPEWFTEHDIHVHVPAGAVPKDGPSAGITMAVAIASLVRGVPVADDVGMTGEITLTGQVLPIGGIREKVLAAERAGLKRVIIPRENEPDLEELPAETREALTFVLADTIQDVLQHVRRAPAARTERQASRARAPGRLTGPFAASANGNKRPAANDSERTHLAWPRRKTRIYDTADTVRPYVDRAVHDEELRENLKEAFNAAREVYSELLGNRNLTSTATRVATDKDIQDNLKRTIEELRKATDRIQGKEDHGTRNTLLLLTGITMGILFNPMTGPQTRAWLMEKITGESSDDFGYGTSSTTSDNGPTTSPAA